MVIINDGDGKGKTTAAIGQAIRSIGQGLRVKIIQLIKNGSSGEIKILQQLKIAVEQYGLGFTSKGDKTQHKISALKGVEAIKNSIDSGQFDMIICDEINYAVSGGLIEEKTVIDLIEQANRSNVHLILTGRGATDRMIESADIVTRMSKVKHAFDKGIKAQAGIEF